MEGDVTCTHDGFRVIGVKLEEDSSVLQHILWKPHKVREYNICKPPDKTLLIVNIPPYVTKDCLKRNLECFGAIDNILFQKKPHAGPVPETEFPFINPEPPVKGFKVAYIVFKNSKGVKNSMNAPQDQVLTWSTPSEPLLVGLEKWQEEYNTNFKSEEELRKEVTAIMSDYDKRVELKKKEEDNEPDQNGWLTVASSNKRKRPTLKEGDEKRATNSNRRRKKKRAEHVDFYAFQLRERKMEHLSELRKKFEEDKKRIALMRASRRFKPMN